MKKFVICALYTINICLAVKYEYSFVDLSLLASTFGMSYHFFSRMNGYRDYVLSLYIVLYLVLSTSVVSLFELSSIGFYKDTIYPKEYAALAIWGNRLQFVAYFTLYLSNSYYRNSRNIEVVGRPVRNFSNKIDKTFFNCTIAVYCLAAISKALGISDMTNEARVVLPFHLNGIIDEFRSNVYPFLFAIYVFDCLSKNKIINSRYFLYFFVYVILEIFVRSSKGALLFSFLPLLELYAFLGKYTKSMIVKYIIPLFIVAISIFSIIDVARRGGAVSISSMQSAYEENKSKSSDEQTSPYIRAFLTGVYYTKLIDLLPDSHLEFDFKRVPVLISMRGGSSYMTEIIDDAPSGSYHSSGVTGLCDALLWGGYPLGYLVLSLLVILVGWGDHALIMRQTPLYKVILFYLIYRILTGRSISLFIDELFFSTIVSTVIKIVIIKYYYKKYY